jgi:hypothetical protein
VTATPDLPSHRLREAYRATLYRFDTPDGELLLQVDRYSPALQQLLQDTAQTCASVLTACNPGSVLQEEGSNLRAQAALRKALRDLGVACLPGRHVDPEGRWPDEAGILALGIDCAVAHDLAARHGQLAFLWSDHTATPRLIETGITGGSAPRS